MKGTLTRRMPGRLAPHGAFEPISRLREELEDLFSRFWHEEEGFVAGPSLDLSETDDALQVKMDLPGVKAEDIDIQISGNLLTVSGERTEEKEEKGRTFHRIERRGGRFSRTVALPCEVDEDKIEAVETDGVLTIALPKSEKVKSRKIEVKS